MLTSLSWKQKKMELTPILEGLGLKDISSVDWRNKMLAIHMMQAGLELAKDAGNDVLYPIMMTLACYYGDRGFFDESTYWYQKCLNDCGSGLSPFQKLHARGSLLLNLIHLGNMPDAEDLLRDLLTETPGPSDAAAYYDQAQALRLYFEAKVLSMGEDMDREEIESTISSLLDICDGYGAYLLMRRLQCGALEILACQSRRAGEYDNAVALFKRTAAKALTCGTKQKAAVCRKEISAIYEAMDDQKQACIQYKKYYRMSQRIYRKKSEEFSASLLAKNNLDETERELGSLREMKEYLSLRRNTDPLTGVSNRRFWDESLAEKAEASGPDDVYSILMLDIDSFKEYNDAYGHLEGDRALKTIGGLLRECIRPDQDVLARFGGDEFILLTDGIDEGEARDLAGRILAGVRDHSFSGNDISLSVSVGVSTGPIRWDRGFEGLLTEADAALYYSKQHGKDRYTHIRDTKGTDRHDR